MSARQISHALTHLTSQKQWWVKRTGKQSVAQIAFGINISLLALGLPLGWNYVVEKKWSQWYEQQKEKADVTDPTTLEMEAMIVETLVNERRKQRGLSLYSYDYNPSKQPGADALFSRVLAAYAKDRSAFEMSGQIPVYASADSTVPQSQIKTAMKAVPPPVAGKPADDCACER
jgi:hypothetical protein